MSCEATPKQPDGSEPGTEAHAPAPRSGCGADTAFAAMLKKRRSASNGAPPPEPDPQLDDAGKAVKK